MPGLANPASTMPYKFNELFRTNNISVKPKYKILVVDDDLELNTSFALLLEFDGHEVHTAYTGEAALEKLARTHFDLMISEYWLARMRGDELAMLVKARWPELPIIMVTANFEEICVEHPIPGVNCLLDKPFTMNQLREAMSWVMGQSEESVKPPDKLEVHWVHGGYRSASDNPRVAPKASGDFGGGRREGNGERGN